MFAQIGLIMLIGLAAKNAILIVEFAKMLHEQGKDPVTAALEAARLRFRPILMTAFAFILGVVPLLTATGAGAEGRKVMGMAVFSGMLIATILGRAPHPGARTWRWRSVTATRSARAHGHRAPYAHHRHASQPPHAGRATNPDRASLACAALRVPFARALAVGCAGRSGLQASASCQPPPAYRCGRTRSRARDVADLPWWQVFDDQALQELQREAIAHNLDLRAAMARVAEARALSGVANSFLYPDINPTAGYAANQGSRDSQPPGALQQVDRTYNNTHLAGRASWDTDLFGRLRRSDEAAFGATWRARKAAAPSS